MDKARLALRYGEALSMARTRPEAFVNILLQGEKDVKIVHVGPGRTGHNMGIELFEERIGVVFPECADQIQLAMLRLGSSFTIDDCSRYWLRSVRA